MLAVWLLQGFFGSLSDGKIKSRWPLIGFITSNSASICSLSGMRCSLLFFILSQEWFKLSHPNQCGPIAH
ncbi:Uncharacterised protein [Vibrio cholerae]|nr:Uncharacterised protein [Vibrio cholerae]CSC64797.1 Uncharacterised protein [Vibrio cholerae]CSC98554.1 Uncharacterised protein [Vibrio cholerae]